ncbi:MAG TPA: hypothetical protein VMU45_06350 [Candidatus Eisenbacteria bacterium]|nr:hypothetical protein [Candidatus Eisenbacteria bacterium]
MPLQLPNLDNRTYEDLLEEALALIPTFSPEWTNFNPSDAGITLVELFAYLSEMLIYRLNRVTDANVKKFVKLLNGPDYVVPADADLREQVRQAVLGIRERYRAVTADDYEFLSTTSFNQLLAESNSTLPKVARAHCVPRRNLDAGQESDRLTDRPEHVSVVILPATADTDSVSPQPSQALIDALFSFLDERRIVTTRIHVAGPVYAPVATELVVARMADVLESDLRPQIENALKGFLAPMRSNAGDGWPFGRDVFVSEVYDLLEKIPGVDFVTDVMLTSQAKPGDPHSVAADPVWHSEGDLVGLRIQPHHLPLFDTANTVIAPSSNFITVNIAITAKGTTDPASLKRAIRATVRDQLHPAHHGPNPKSGQPMQIFSSDIASAVDKIPGVVSPSKAEIVSTVPASAGQTDPQRGAYIQVAAGQLLNWRVQITLN